jgi:uncharacterized protein (DUF1684 family)
MRARLAFLVLACAATAGCARERWPDPPPNDQAQYQKDHEAWREEQAKGVPSILQIAGIWSLEEGDTAFGADGAVPIVLPAAHFPPRAGVFRRAGGTVTVVPAPGATLRLSDGSLLKEARQTDGVSSGPIQLQVLDEGNDRHWVMAIDTAHPALANPPVIESYPPDQRWRVAARFDAFPKPRPVRVPDVRGGFADFAATGELVFHVPVPGSEQQEMRLTAFGEEGSDELFVMFKDRTNGSTTYQGYRILSPKAVKAGEFTVLDFNFAMNPPCAYSKFTTCPLPPPENRVPVAVEAGLKRLPSAQGFVP